MATTKRKKKPVRRSDAGAKRFPTRPVNLKIPLPPGAGPFGEGPDLDPEDSAALSRLRSIIDQEIGWASALDEEAGDYEARLREVAKALAFFDVRRVVNGKVKR